MWLHLVQQNNNVGSNKSWTTFHHKNKLKGKLSLKTFSKVDHCLTGKWVIPTLKPYKDNIMNKVRGNKFNPLFEKKNV